MRRILIRAAALLLPMSMAAAAGAEVALCNVSDGPIALAYGAQDPDGNWETSGLGTTHPGECGHIYVGDEDGYSYAYRTDEPGFAGDGLSLCVDPSEEYFYISGAADCAAEGHASAGFRRIELPEGRNLVINLDGRGGTVPVPDLPLIDLSQPFQPAPGPAPGPAPDSGPAPGPAPGGDDIGYASGFVPGSLGQPFGFDAVWQGCGRDRLGAFCAFYAAGWKLYAPEGEANAAAFLARLRAIPMGAAVTVSGDMIHEDSFWADVALAEVVVHAENPFAGLFEAIQGEWVSADDPGYRMSITGSEITETYAGEETGQRSLELRVGCVEGQDAPAITTTDLGTGDSQCFLFDALSDDEMVLAPAGQGGFVAFRRP